MKTQWKNWLVPCSLTYLLTACVTDPSTEPPQEPEILNIPAAEIQNESPRAVEVQDLPYESMGNNNPEQSVPTIPPVDHSKPADADELVTMDDCVVFTEKIKEPPFFSRELGVVFTRVAKMCRNADGKKGFVPHSPWLAMGFPCTGGGGRVSWTGTQNAPKAIHFTMANGCPLQPAGLQELAHKMQQTNYSSAMKVIGYAPLAISYWQLPDFPDHDTGEVLDFVSKVGIERGWKQFLEDKPIRVRLIGRENAFVRSEFLYEVMGAIKHNSRRSFIFEVHNVTVLSNESKEQFRQSCGNLGQSRNCQEIFGGPISDEY